MDGCFWHGCPKHATQPKTNAAFWRDKIAGNSDSVASKHGAGSAFGSTSRRVNAALRKLGWTVLRVWQHELSRKNEARLLQKLGRFVSPRKTRRVKAAPRD